MSETKREKLICVCAECGSRNVQLTAWVDCITELDTQDEGPSAYGFCPVCEDGDASIDVRDATPEEVEHLEHASLVARLRELRAHIGARAGTFAEFVESFSPEVQRDVFAAEWSASFPEEDA